MNIIHTTAALIPEFGGPARSVPALCYELADQGHSVKLVHFDFFSDQGKVPLPVHANLEYTSVPVAVNLGLHPVLTPQYKNIIREVTAGKERLIVHDHGIWLPYSGVLIQEAKRSGAKVITSPRGMLEPWAMNYRRIRKLVAWHLYQRNRLSKNDLLHATSRLEAENLQLLGLSKPISVIPNGINIPPLVNLEGQRSGNKRTALFLSRIHPKKGLINLVKAVKEIKPDNWQVMIAGYNEDGYQDYIQDEVLKAGVEKFFIFHGPVSDDDKWELFAQADLFVLPSHSENFGIVVAEALASGTPVLTTQGTPWKDLVDYGCGWWVEPTLKGLVFGLQDAFSRQDSDLIEMGARGRKLIKKKYSWIAVAKKMIEVYSWVLGDKQDPPDSLYQGE